MKLKTLSGIKQAERRQIIACFHLYTIEYKQVEFRKIKQKQTKTAERTVGSIGQRREHRGK